MTMSMPNISWKEHVNTMQAMCSSPSVWTVLQIPLQKGASCCGSAMLTTSFGSASKPDRRPSAPLRLDGN